VGVIPVGGGEDGALIAIGVAGDQPPELIVVGAAGLDQTALGDADIARRLDDLPALDGAVENIVDRFWTVLSAAMVWVRRPRSS